MIQAETRNGRSDVIVIGGGVVGLSCAWFLLRAGLSVRVIEQRRIGNGSSFGNSGLITPSMAAPLPAPGVLRKLPGWLSDKRSPLYIKPRLDIHFLDWARRFAGFCNEAAMLHAMRARYALLDSSRALFDELMETEQLDCDWEPSGLYIVYRSEAEMREGDAMDRRLQELGIPLRHVSAAELLAEEPALRNDVVGARYFAGDARLRPDRLLSEWLARIVARGAAIEEGCEMQGVVTEGSRISGLATPSGTFSADHYVLATGAWSPRLGRQLGLRLPIEAGKGYSLTMRRPERCPRRPLLLKERLVSITPWESGFRLGGTMEFAGLDRTLNRARIEAIVEAARTYLTDPLADPEVEHWFGWRPMTPDGLPLIGRSYRHDNLFVAAGHNMLGVSMSPATGRLVAELVTRSAPHVDPAPYALERFR